MLSAPGGPVPWGALRLGVVVGQLLLWDQHCRKSPDTLKNFIGREIVIWVCDLGSEASQPWEASIPPFPVKSSFHLLSNHTV